MTQLALLEALTSELYDVIENYHDAIPLAAVIGVLEVLKYEMLHRAAKEMQ